MDLNKPKIVNHFVSLFISAPCDLSDEDMSVTDCQDDMLGGSGGIGSGMAGGLADGGAGSGRGGRGGGGKVKNSDRKSARARTVLSEKQLNILKTCYSANPRPDALMKEQLVEMTGLSPRVVRVWFQNKRCKDKKLQIRASEKQLQRDAVSELHLVVEWDRSIPESLCG